jgi:hypothetical protein
MTTAPDHDGDLATLLREHVQEHEPPFALSADTSIALGRRTLVRRRARRGLAGVLVAAAAVAAVPLLPWGGGPTGGDDIHGIDPATAAALEHYDAQTMPDLIDEHVRAILGRSVDELGPVHFEAGDAFGQPLPEKYYDKASSMDVTYGGTSDHRFRVSLMHAASEAEGDADEICKNDLEDGTSFRCKVTTSQAGDTVTTTVNAVRVLDVKGAGWSNVSREELRTGIPAKGDPDQSRIDPSEVYFMRTVEVVHSKTFLTVAQEIVKAPDLAAADAAWEVSPADLEEITTDPVLVIPTPPLAEDGCGWRLPGSDFSCAH